MNRKLYVGIMSFFSVVFTISILFLPFYNPIYFYLQHVSLFLFMAMFIYYLLKLGYDRLEKRITKKTALKGYTVSVFVVLLFLFSNVQLYMIETYQTNEFQSCFYYDHFDNAIYYSQVPNSCPDLEITEQTNTTLSFTVIEEDSGNDDYDYIDGIDLEDINYTSSLTTYVDIRYDEKGNIIESTMVKFSSIILEDGRHIVNTISSRIENITIYEGDDPIRFESYQSTEYNNDVFSSYKDPEGEPNNREYVKYISEKTDHEMNSNTIEDMFQIVITKETYDNREFSGEPITTTVMQQLDFSCDEFECFVEREDINVPKAEYLVMVEQGVFDSDLDYTFRLSASGVEIQYPYYHYQDNEKSFTTVTYTDFNGSLFFKSNEKSYSNMFNRPIERRTFKYGGNYYLEHGDLYSVIYKTDYGLKIMNKSLEPNYEYNGMIIYSSSVMFDVESFYRSENIYDYGIRAIYNLSGRDEILYQENPLIYTFLEFQE